MNKRLEALIERVPTWPKEAQDEAARALEDVERKYYRDSLQSIRDRIAHSLADPRPDIDAADVLAEIEKEYEANLKKQGNAS
jgi:hypothetical protein